MSPSPARPWHLAHAPRNVSRPRSLVPASWASASSSSQLSNSSRGSGLHRGRHRCVLDPAELRALPAVDAGRGGVEPRLVDHARNGVELAPERRDPPRVDDLEVGCRDLEPHVLVHRGAQAIDRDDPVGVLEVPVVPIALHLDVDPAARRARRGHVLDVGQLQEDEAADRHEDQHRRDGPRELEVRVAVHLGAVLAACPPAAIANDEEEQRSLNEQEDRAREDRHPVVRLVDRLGVRRAWLDGGEPGLRECAPGEDERQRDRAEEG